MRIYHTSVDLIIMTKVINRTVARVGAAILIICGFFPPIGYFIRTIPNPVIGGVLLVGIWKETPPLVESIFSQNVVAVVFVIAFLLNLVLPKNME